MLLKNELEYTRKALELIRGATLITKSDCVLRDLDLLKAINDRIFNTSSKLRRKPCRK